MGMIDRKRAFILGGVGLLLVALAALTVQPPASPVEPVARDLGATATPTKTATPNWATVIVPDVAIVVDGNLAEWTAVPAIVINSTTAANIQRSTPMATNTVAP